MEHADGRAVIPKENPGTGGNNGTHGHRSLAGTGGGWE